MDKTVDVCCALCQDVVINDSNFINSINALRGECAHRLRIDDKATTPSTLAMNNN